MNKFELFTVFVLSVLVLFTLIFQFVLPMIDGTQTFPSFRRKKIKGVRKAEDIESELDEVDDAAHSLRLEQRLKQEREKLAASRQVNPTSSV